MYQTQNRCRTASSLLRWKKFMLSVKGASHLSRRAKRRLYCKIQLWFWRKRSEKRRLWLFRGRRGASGIRSGSQLGLKQPSQKVEVLTSHFESGTVAEGSAAPEPAGRPDGGSGGGGVQQNGWSGWSGPETLSDSDCLQVTDSNFSSLVVGQTMQTALASELSVQLREMTDPLKLIHTIKDCDEQPEFLSADPPSQQHSHLFSYQNQTTESVDDRISSEAASQTNVCLKELKTNIQDFLGGFYRRYGSFIPLFKDDLLGHLKRKFDSDFSDRNNLILSEFFRCQATIVEKPIPSFQVVYKKHRLALEDLQTLADQSWLNDQVMNMYGELIMESSHHKVHFLNSFFHRQLMTKGYDGVKRWTKQVDLFSKSLLLVPVHLEVHWCLVTADIATKKICLYDSQGNALQKVARNILKYLMTEAKEKKQAAFEDGWTVSYDEKVPQQTNENDCGVFVLEYSRCLALSRPFQFSQKDIPKIRKRIYKELCDCKLHEVDWPGVCVQTELSSLLPVAANSTNPTRESQCWYI